MALATVSRFVLGILLLFTSLSKILNFRWFEGTIKTWIRLSARLAATASILVIGVEGVIGAFLLAGPRLGVVWAAAAAIALFSCFSIGVGLNLLHKRLHLSCGCCGFSKTAKIGWQIILRNLGLCGLTVICLLPTGTSEWTGILLFVVSAGLTLAPSTVALLRKSPSVLSHSDQDRQASPTGVI